MKDINAIVKKVIEEIRQIRQRLYDDRPGEKIPDSLLVFKRGNETRTLWTEMPAAFLEPGVLRRHNYQRITPLLRSGFVFDSLLHNESGSMARYQSSLRPDPLFEFRELMRLELELKQVQ